MHVPACTRARASDVLCMHVAPSLLPQYLLVTALSDHEELVNSRIANDDMEPEEQEASQRSPVDIAQSRSSTCACLRT